MYDIRIQLEGQAAARAAKNVTDEQLNEMQEVIDLQKFYTDKPGDVSNKSNNIRDMDSSFHELLYRASGSVVFHDTLSNIHKKILKFRKASVSDKSRAEQSYEEHLAILDALRLHEPELARSRTVQHIINARDNIKKRLAMMEEKDSEN